MQKYLSLLMLATLAACGGDTGTTDSTAGDDDDDDDACNNSILSQFPINGETDVYFKTDVRFALAAADTTATITVADAASGTAVNGSTVIEGTLVSWTGDDLAPSTAYNATLSYGCGDATVSWTTSSTGASTTVDLTNKVYDLDLAGGEWVQPAGIGELLAVELEDVQLLVSPIDVQASTITMLGANGNGDGTQDTCAESLPFPTANWTDPYFEIETPQLDLDIEGYAFTIEDLLLSGAFAPDGSRIQGTVFQGFVDTRPLVDLLVPGGDEDSVCELTLTFGVPCEECTGGGTFCLSVYVDSVGAALVPGADPLVEITADDIDPVACDTGAT